MRALGDRQGERATIGVRVLGTLAFVFFVATLVSLAMSVVVDGSAGGFPSSNGPAGYFVKTAGVTGSLAVSLALAAIYLDQNHILKEHRNLMAEQAETMRDRSRPILMPARKVSLHRGEPSPATDSPGTETKDVKDINEVPWASVFIKNRGNDVAHSLHLVTLVHVDDSGGGGTDESDEDAPFPGWCQVDVADTSTESSRGDALQPTDGLSLVKTIPQFSREPDGDGAFIPFCRQLEELLRTEDHPVRFGFVLVYTGSVREQFYVPLNDAYSIAPTDYDSNVDDILTPTQLSKITSTYNIEDLLKQTDWAAADELVRQ